MILDACLAVLVLSLGAVDLTGATTYTTDGVHIESTDALAVFLLLLGSLPLLQRRRAPVTVLAVTSTAFFMLHAFGYARPPISYGPLVALFTATARCRPGVCIGGTFGVMTGALGAALANGDSLTEDRFLADLVTITGAGLLGYAVQLGRSRAALLEEHTAQLEREHAARMELAVEQQMARIAGELHDIVAHDVTVMVAQAGAGRRVAGDDPQLGRQALASVEELGRSALAELRLLLGALHGSREAGRNPQPTLDQLPGLTEQLRAAGLHVDLDIQGAPRRLPLGVELNAFRIVQEALTNTLKHGHGASARVTVAFGPRELSVDVRDDGKPPCGEPVAGHGLIGMQRRVALLGGELAVGPAPGGGFRVTARLPLDREEA